MQAREMMTTNPACCSPKDTIREVARMMVEHDCGEIPVVDLDNHPIGVITDRDICCRVAGEGLDSNTAIVHDHMSTPAITVHMQDSVERCSSVMEEHMIRRVPVVNTDGKCVGIIAQADFANKADSYSVSHLVREVSASSEPMVRQYFL